MGNSSDPLPTRNNLIIRVLRLARPLHLFFILLTYSLGAGIADYLGKNVNLIIFISGGTVCICVFTSMLFFSEYFEESRKLTGGVKNLPDEEKYHLLNVQLAFALLTLAAIFIIILFYQHSLTISSGMLLVLMVFLLVLYAIPPLSLSNKGYSELIQAIFLGTLVPGAGFLLQTGSYHRLLTLSTFPLTLLALAWLLISDFPGYAKDQKYQRNTFLTKLTWQNAVPVHHFLIFSAFFLFALTPLLGIPLGLGLAGVPCSSVRSRRSDLVAKYCPGGENLMEIINFPCYGKFWTDYLHVAF